MPPFGGVFEIEGVNPRERRGETTEVKMVFNGKMIAALGVNGSDILFDFLESAFDFPSCGVKFNHLFCSKSQVSANQRERKSPVIDEYNFDLASEGFGHAEKFGKFHRALLAVNVDFGCSGRSSQLGGKLFDRGEAFAEFGVASASAGNNLRKLEEPCVDAKPCKKLDGKSGIFSDLLKERLASEPTVADDEGRTLEEGNYSQDKFRADAGLSIVYYRFQPDSKKQGINYI